MMAVKLQKAQSANDKMAVVQTVESAEQHPTEQGLETMEN